jgi:hypothetical protein
VPPFETLDRRQDAVLWPWTGFDRYAQPVFGPPEAIMVRWVDKQREMMDPQRNSIIVDGTAVVNLDVSVQSLIWKGCIDSIIGNAAPPNLMEVKAFNETPSLKNKFKRRTLGFMRYKGSMPSTMLSPTATAVVTSGSPTLFGQPVTFTATVTGNAPTGVIEFYSGTALIDRQSLGTNGQAQTTTTLLETDGHTIIAKYLGDQVNAPSISPAITQVVT